jgi:orotate phosphoribosyltransferase
MDDLARRIRMASKLSGNFTLRSGRVSDTYFDKYRFEADPALLLAIANAMTP